MSLEQIKASPHPGGNQINLSWVMPSDASYTGVRVVRRVSSYPTGPDDGINVAQAPQLMSAVDTGLQAQQIYYYTLFPYQGDPPVFEVDHHNRTAAMATSAEDFAGYMYELLPAIYHRYDRDSEALKSFLELPGGQLDQLYSFAKATGDLQNSEKVSGNLLPLLAQWIGWRTDYKLELSAQRTEIRHAPTIYESIGLIPLVEATIKRNSGWESRTKEFIHNIFATNRPAHLNLWSMTRDDTDTWSESAELVSMDYAYEGRPTSTLDDNNIRWLFYHTQRKGRWEIWFKSSPTISLALQFQEQLIDGLITPELLTRLIQAGFILTPTTTITTVTADLVWEITDATESYIIELHHNELLAYHTTAELTALDASQPIIVGGLSIYRYPSVAQQLQTLWLFWSAFDEDQQHWQIQYRRRRDAQWLDIAPVDPDPALDNPFAVGGIYDPVPQRRMPYAVLDGDNRLWLFWIEDNGSGWQLRYNRRDGGGWGIPVDFPNGAVDPRVNQDFSVLIQPTLPDQRIYVFWSRPAETLIPGQIRWEVAYRVKEDLDLTDLNWTAVQSLPKDGTNDNHHDRDPMAILHNNNVELFWSSNREDAGWSVWRSVLIDYTTNTWDAGETERLTDGTNWQRDPLPIISVDTTWLIFRSNQGLGYHSEVYGATETFDERYVGSTTVDIRHTQKFALWKTFEDIQRYTYDAGKNGKRTNDDWIARDTIGVYLDNDTLDTEQVEAGIARLKLVLNEFMPITDRAVFIPSTTLHTEYVYSYGLPLSAGSKYLSSTYQDELNSVLITSAFGVGEDFVDSLDA